MNEAVKIIKDNLRDESVVVATSGGPDSMALLYLVNSLKESLNLKVVCAHVNHKLRKESDDEAVMVKEFCRKNNLIFKILTIDSYNDDNFHNDARIKRYNFFDSCVNSCQAKHLLTAHHGDDLMETILMRIVRGSSLRGYSGFSLKMKKNNYIILRPLINYTKDEILCFVKDNNIPYAVDVSNEKDIYTRNRFRKYILSPLKKEDNMVHEKFYKFSKTLQLYDDYVSKETAKFFNEAYTNGELNIKLLQSYDHLIRIKIIEKLFEQHYQDDLTFITDKHIGLVNDLIFSSKPNQIINLPNGKVCVKSYNFLKIKDCVPTFSYEFEFDEFITLPNNKIIKISDTLSNSNNVCRLSKKDVKFPLYIRNRKEGDKIEIKGLNGSKKVKDIFIDKKIPKEDRLMWPVVVDSNNNIVWIPGLKKSKFDKQKFENYDIILEYI